MILLICIYFLTIKLVIDIKGKIKLKTTKLTNVTIYQDHVECILIGVYKINILQAKVINKYDKIFIKNNDTLITISGANVVGHKQHSLYFKAQGKITIKMHNPWYRYFNILIQSNQFQITKLRHLAMLSIIENPFNFLTQKSFKDYMYFVKHILKISFNSNGIKIVKNNYDFIYSVTFKINGKTKKLNINL